MYPVLNFCCHLTQIKGSYVPPEPRDGHRKDTPEQKSGMPGWHTMTNVFFLPIYKDVCLRSGLWLYSHVVRASSIERATYLPKTLAVLFSALEPTNTATMSSSQKKQISIHVTVHIAPENVDKFFAAYQPVYDSVIAEPECTFFQVYQDPQNPGTLTWVENWFVHPFHFHTFFEYLNMLS